MSAWQAIQKDVRKRGGSPFVTSRTSDGRIELSGTSFLNAVSKAANFIQSELEFDDSQTVQVKLGHHWQSAVWNAATLSAGLTLADYSRTTDAHVNYLATHNEELEHTPPNTTMICISKNLLGVPDEQVDYPRLNGSLLVRSQPDNFSSALSAQDAFVTDSEIYSYADLVSRANELVTLHGISTGHRVALVGHGSLLENCLWHFVVPVEHGINIVLLDEISKDVEAQERISHVVEFMSVG